MGQSISSSNPKPVSQRTMPDPKIIRQVFGLIAVTYDTIDIYGTIEPLCDLPKAFHEVGKYLPLAQETLEKAQAPAKNVESDDDANVLGGRLGSCKEKGDKLLKIFQTIAKDPKGKYDASVYRSIAVKLGKHRVETLMIGILEDLEVLAAHCVFRAVMQTQVELLKSAKQELANVPPSLSDSDLDEQPGTANHYGNGKQFIHFGAGAMNNVDGHYFEARGNQNFGMIPPKESTGGKGP